MNEVILQALVAYILMIIVGFGMESLFMKIHFKLTKRHYKEHHFTFSKYILFLLFPIIMFSIVAHNYGISVVKVFSYLQLPGLFSNGV